MRVALTATFMRVPGVTRAPQVCCTESNPAWLLVSLGAVRPISAILLVVGMEMTYTLALSNSSTGPFVTVVTQFCDSCLQNGPALSAFLGMQRSYAVSAAGAPMSASFVLLQITWSTHGGIGACSDMCDWATNVHRFAVFGPGELPANALPATEPPPAGPFVACPDVNELIAQRVGIEGNDVMLTGGAQMQPAGSGAHGSTAIRLTAAEPLQRGAAEFTRIVRPMDECGACSDPHRLHASLHVWMGGSRELPGEGLVVSLVDATKQTPGATQFVHIGCGVRLALPLHALSIVFDTSGNDEDASCGGADLHGTGIRLVSTIDADAPPVVLRSTLDTSIAGFRTAGWVPLDFDINYRGTWVPDFIHVNGDEQLSGILVGAALDAFYIVASAVTTAGADAHLISMLQLNCTTESLAVMPENWAGYRQPFTPPPMLPPPPPQQVLLTPSPALHMSAAPSFAAAFGVTTALVAVAAALVVCLRRRSRAAAPAEVKSASLNGPLELVRFLQAYEHVVNTDQAEAAASHDFDVFLAYRRADYGLADTVQDKLRLCGLRVFKDKDGRLAGTPFGIEILRVIRSAPVFAPVVTLASLQRMAGAAAPDAEADACLAEWLAALHFRARGWVQLIYPLLLGASSKPGQETHFGLLTDDLQYALALAALPDAAPVSTMRAVTAALSALGETPLSAELASMSVRDIAAAVLATPAFAVNCLPADLGLYIRSRCAPLMLRVAEETHSARSTLDISSEFSSRRSSFD